MANPILMVHVVTDNLPESMEAAILVAIEVQIELDNRLEALEVGLRLATYLANTVPMGTLEGRECLEVGSLGAT